MGKAMMGTGEATGDNRAIQAAEKAIANPLLDEISLNGAKGVLINITGGYDLTLFELDEAANIIREKVDPDANIIVGSTLDTSMEGAIRVSVVATGIDASMARADAPVARRSMAQPLAAAPEMRREAVGVPTSLAAQAMILETAAEPVQDLFHPHLENSSDYDDAMDLDEDEIEDDLPAPVYRPQSNPMAARTPAPATPVMMGDDAAGFVAPRPRAMGTPSPEALARLQAAVNKNPGMARAAAPAMASRAVAPEPAPRPAEKPRFGIGSLINRMAGNSTEATPERLTPAQRIQPQVASYDDEPELTADQERIEIPAFLRRQAN
jgi:cell division protein FtsZ